MPEDQPFSPTVRRRRRSHLSQDDIVERLQQLEAQKLASEPDPRQAEKKRNTEIRPQLEQELSHLMEVIKNQSTDEIFQLILNLLNPDSSLKQFFNLSPKSEAFLENTQYLIENEEYLKAFSAIATDSHYDNWLRASNVNLSFFAPEEFVDLIDSIADEEVRDNIIRSLLLVIIEELTHFVQFNRADNGLSPFLSSHMQPVTFDERYETESKTRTEADVTFYLRENGVKVEGSYWLENHRQNYGDETKLFEFNH